MGKYYNETEGDGNVWNRENIDNVQTGFDDVEADLVPAYGGMSIASDRGVTIGLTLVVLDSWDDEESSNVTIGLAAGTVTIGTTGVYNVNGRVHIEGADSLRTYTLEVHVNGVAASEIGAGITAEYDTDIEFSFGAMPTQLQAGDVLTVRLGADQDGQNITVTNASLVAVMLAKG